MHAFPVASYEGAGARDPIMHNRFQTHDLRFDAEIEDRETWPAKARKWLSVMQLAALARSDLATDRDLVEFYILKLGPGPSHVLAQQINIGTVSDFASFHRWFQNKYVSLYSTQSVHRRLQRMRQKGTVKSYVSEFLKIDRAGSDIVAMDVLRRSFLRGLKNKILAFEVRLRMKPNMLLDELADLVFDQIYAKGYNALGFPRGSKKRQFPNQGRAQAPYQSRGKNLRARIGVNPKWGASRGRTRPSPGTHLFSPRAVHIV